MTLRYPQQMQDYLEDVQALVAPRLTNPKYRDRAMHIPVLWDTIENHMDNRPWEDMLMIVMDHHVPNGEHHQDRLDERNDIVTLYKEGIPFNIPSDVVPFGQTVAFVLCHELAHAACRCSEGHESLEWEKCCRELGIKEQRYSTKGLDWKHNFSFTDMGLWERIRRLPSYPGPVYASAYNGPQDFVSE